MGIESEAILSRLCQRSFLSLWSYPNPYNDRDLAKRKEGKELCDLLVIFGDDVIIFSDKSCAFPNTGNEELDWKRWYQRAVSDSVKQIKGAERWIREHPERVYADNRCTTRLLPRIPPLSRIRVHRVVVALGARTRCQQHFNGGSGSLPITGGGHSLQTTPPRSPFYLGSESTPETFVHVLDEVSIEFVLRQLDTAADFIEYLSKKEELFSKSFVVATGEEDLLAHYLLTAVDGRHSFLPSTATDPEAPVNGFTGLLVNESAFPTLVKLPQYIESKRANEISYLWDNLVEHFIRYWRDGELEHAVDSTDFETALRTMAAPSRVVRRQLGRMIFNAMNTERVRGARYLCVMDKGSDAIAYAVVSMAHFDDIDYATYRERRRFLMLLHARSLRLRLPSLQEVLVIGLHPASDEGGSEDMGLIRFIDWDDEVEAETREQMQMFGMGAAPIHYTEHEFPEPPARPASREALRRQRQMERQRKRSTP